MMSLCFITIFTFFFQLFDPELLWSPISFIGISLSSFRKTPTSTDGEINAVLVGLNEDKASGRYHGFSKK